MISDAEDRLVQREDGDAASPGWVATPGIWSLNSSITEGTAVMKRAPRIGPNVVPTPPTTIMAMYCEREEQPEVAGRHELLVGAEQRSSHRGQRARHDERRAPSCAPG